MAGGNARDYGTVPLARPGRGVNREIVRAKRARCVAFPSALDRLRVGDCKSVQTR